MRHNIDNNHEEKRNTLRMLGGIILGIGIIFTLIGLFSFFSAMGSGPSFRHKPNISFQGGVPSFSQPSGPRYFWCAFIGLPLCAIGGSMLKFGYMGSVARYASQELTPVATDSFNYVAKNASEGIREVASSIKEGLSDKAPSEHKCPKCGATNATDAKFCCQCGVSLKSEKICPACGDKNQPDAKFCDNCGRKFDL